MRSLAAQPQLGLHVLAGKEGLDRPISWANPTDMPDPTGWMFGDELVLITNLGFPTSDEGQLAYLKGLIEGGASGLILSIRAESPPLTSESVELADRESFPVLSLPYDIAFSNIVRHVAFAVHADQTPPMAAVQRLYETALAMTAGSLDAGEVLERLAQALDAELALIDAGAGRVEAQTDESVGTFVEEATERLRRSSENAPTFLRFEDPLATALRIPTFHNLYLVALGSSMRPALAPLQHASAILALSRQFDAAEVELDVVSASRQVDALIAGQIPVDRVVQRLQRIGLGQGPWVVLAIQEKSVKALLDKMVRWNVPAVPFSAGSDLSHVLVMEEGLATIETFAQSTWIGASVAFSDLEDIREGSAESRLSFRSTFGSPQKIRRYGSGSWSPLAPASLEEADRFVKSVIGPLLEETEHKTWLEPTLRTYLELERSPGATARSLDIHRQTLVNRLQRVEELLGVGLKESDDVAMVWLALRLHDG